MPDFDKAEIEGGELAPGYVACTACGRVVEAGHANTAGRCADCAGKTAAQLEAAAAEPAGNVLGAGGTALVEPDPVPPPGIGPVATEGAEGA